MINIENTLLSGQCFRWKEIDNKFKGIIGNKVYILEKNLDIKDDKVLFNYFDCQTDYNFMNKEIIKRCPLLKDTILNKKGLYILRQDPWEVIISFIISQNNNIKRITKLIDSLCKNYGTKIIDDDFSFPSVKQLENVSEEDFRKLGFGFRARYLVSAINFFKDVDMENFSKKSEKEKEQDLLSICGIGNKVCDCILLYGFHHTSRFPIDTHMKKALSGKFKDLDYKNLNELAGLTQQYIFEYTRENNGKD